MVDIATHALWFLSQKMSILKEMWLFHIIHGEFYEAYHMYQDKIEQVHCLICLDFEVISAASAFEKSHDCVLLLFFW